MTKQKKSDKPNSNVGSGTDALGCAGVVLRIAFLWALIFGVTVGGKHYGASCSCDRGVAVDTSKVAP